MNEVEMGAIVVAITEIIKDLGMASKYCRIFAIVLGIAIAIVNEMQTGGANYGGAALRGLLVGVTATGLYATAKSTMSSSSSSYADSSQETF